MGKAIYRIAWIFSISLFILISGCSKKGDSNPIIPGDQTTGAGSITLNGGGYNNTKINFNVGLAAYSTSDQITNCIFYGKNGSDSVLVVVAFAGTVSGNYQWEEYTLNSPNVNGVVVSFYNASGNNRYCIPKATGQTSISKYGTIGQTIEGLFNGSIQEVVSASLITITGSFKATRVQDE